jgi:hypothetical protein
MPIPHAVPNLRDRLDALVATVITRIEADGPVTPEGAPHALLGHLAPLIDAGTALRDTKASRWAMNAALETRAVAW